MVPGGRFTFTYTPIMLTLIIPMWRQQHIPQSKIKYAWYHYGIITFNISLPKYFTNNVNNIDLVSDGFTITIKSE